MTRPAIWLAVLIFSVTLGLTFGAVATSAHAVLLKATPSGTQTLSAAPGQVQLLFSEPLDPVFSHVQVRDTSGQLVDLGDSHLDPGNEQLLVTTLQSGLPNGVYTVEWRSLSAIDVHPDEGQYALFVGVPVGVTAAPRVAAITATPETTFGRWWFYVAASLFGGVLATWKLVIHPVLDEERLRATVRRRVWWIILIGGILLVVGTLFSAVAQAAAAANVPLVDAAGKPLADLLLRGRYASIWWPRVGLEIASVLLIALGGIDGLASECALATLPAVLLTSALTSHGAALPNAAGAGIVIDWLHIVGACAWVGGLIALATLLPISRGFVPAVVVRFGRLAFVAAAAVLVSGAVQGSLEVGSAVALATTLYGQLVLVKIGLLAAMLLLAGLNEWRVRRSTAALVRGGVGVELLLGVVVFGVAAVLSGTPPTPSS